MVNMIKDIIEANNRILEDERLLRELELNKNSPLFNLDRFLAEHYRLKDDISFWKDKLEKYYKQLDDLLSSHNNNTDIVG
jgi:hypothetical protein